MPFTLTHFFENILKFMRQTSIIATVCLRFYRQTDVTRLKEFHQCLNLRYLASTCLSLYTLAAAHLTFFHYLSSAAAMLL